MKTNLLCLHGIQNNMVHCSINPSNYNQVLVFLASGIQMCITCDKGKQERQTPERCAVSLYNTLNFYGTYRPRDTSSIELEFEFEVEFCNIDLEKNIVRNFTK